MHLCILADGFPGENRPVYAFVEQLVIALTDLGVDISVIAPESITKSVVRKIPMLPKQEHRATSNGNKFIVYRPRVISFGNNKNLQKISNFSRRHAIEKTIKAINSRVPIDIYYGHFWHNGLALAPYAIESNKPLYLACGESEFSRERLCNSFTSQQINRYCRAVTGVISVSSANKRKSIDNRLVEEDKIIVLPNGIDQSVFRILDKNKCRQKLGISNSDFVVAFTGSFIYRKGADRVAAAITRLNNPQIKAIFIGKPMSRDEKYSPACDGIVFKGSVDHQIIPEYMNAADVFVLPTLNEGCCNAIIEAMGCGLPIISSKLPFNEDILDESNSILIDPLDVDQIADAIKRLYENQSLRKSMSNASLAKAKELSISQRASKVLKFISKSNQ